MALCCGREVSTPYCPECGTKLGSPLWQLLAHCRHQEANAFKFKNTLEGMTEPDSWKDRNPDRWRRRVKKANDVWLKWKAWADAIAGMLNLSSVNGVVPIRDEHLIPTPEN